MDKMSATEKLARYWTAQGLAPQGGAAIDAVGAFEETHRVVVPDDFREYLLRLNGLADYGPGADQNGFGFWPLSRIRPVATEERPPHFTESGYFVFADYLDWSWAYAIQLLEDRAHGHVTRRYGGFAT